jgi:hypothetical protein
MSDCQVLKGGSRKDVAGAIERHHEGLCLERNVWYFGCDKVNVMVVICSVVLQTVTIGKTRSRVHRICIISYNFT